MNRISCSLLTILAATVLFTACQKDSEHLVDLSAVIADQSGSNAKVYINGNYGCWQQGDVVKVKSGSNGTNNYSLKVEGSGVAADKATIKDVVEGTPYTAGYPGGNVTPIGNGTLNIEVPSSQSYVEAAIYDTATTNEQRIVCPMAAYSADGTTLRFYNVAAMLAVTVTNSESSPLTLYSVEVESDKSPLSGTATVTVNADTAYISSKASTSNNVTLTFGTTVTLAARASKTVYIPVLPIGSDEVEKSTLTVHVKATANADGTGSKYTFHGVSRQPLSIAQNQMGNVPISLNTKDSKTEVNDYFWGQGTKACPYLIESLSDWNNLKSLVSNENYNRSDKYYLQTASEISVGSNSIGTNSNPFKAHYNGGGRSLTSVTTSPFNYADGATITDLTISGAISMSSAYSCGGVVANAQTNKVTIERCTTNVSITQSTYSLFSCGYGGIVGIANIAVEINDCLSQGNITPTNTSDNHIGMCAGGIVGKIAANGCSIDNCTNQGTIGGTRAYHSGNFGGIVGFAANPVTINNCTNGDNAIVKIAGASKTNMNSYGAAGGICGVMVGNGSTISDCVNSGTVQSTTTSSTAVILGGIIGVLHRSATITGCRNEGTVTDECTGNASPYIGGCVGYFYANANNYTLAISNCQNSNTGSVKINANETNATSCGGMIGEINASSSTYCATVNISNCTNNGFVGVSTSITASKANVGGIIGRNNTNGNCVIDACSNNGTVQGYNNGSTYAQAPATGGIVGYSWEGNAETKTCVIRNCWSTSSSIVKNGSACGGIVGGWRVHKSISNCYSLAQIQNAYYGGGVIGYAENGFALNNCYAASTSTSVDKFGPIASHLSTASSINGCYSNTDNPYCEATTLDAFSYTKFTGHGTISASTSGLLDALNAWVGSSDTYLSWSQSESEYPHF